jgi:hypothetical protein
LLGSAHAGLREKAEHVGGRAEREQLSCPGPG